MINFVDVLVAQLTTLLIPLVGIKIVLDFSRILLFKD